MTTGHKVFAYTLGYTTLLASWMTLVVYDVPNSEQLIFYIQSTLSALTGHVLTLIDAKTI